MIKLQLQTETIGKVAKKMYSESKYCFIWRDFGKRLSQSTSVSCFPLLLSLILLLQSSEIHQGDVGLL